MDFALLLGAGFSKWSADLPVASQLFDFDIEPWGPRERRRLELVKSLKRAWDDAHPGGLAEEFIAFALGLDEKDRKALLWYIVRRLSKPFIWQEFHGQRSRRHVLMIDENRRFGIEGVRRAQGFLQRFCCPSFAGIVTTNYDLIVEYALGTRGFNYGERGEVLTGRGAYPVSQWRNPVTLKGTVPLAKIHGSISWDENAFYTDGRRALTGNALIAAPTPEKTPLPGLRRMWDLGDRILRTANHLVVFGFAFNPYDEAVLDLLRHAGSDLISVLLIDISPNLERAQQLWPNASITRCKPPPDGDGAIESWRKGVGPS